MQQDRKFEVEWNTAAPQVMTYCRRNADSQAEAEEIFQHVAVRAWRGYTTFNGTSTFLTWVLTIARRETARILSRKYERWQMETSLEKISENTLDQLPTIPAPEASHADYGWMAEITSTATAHKGLTQIEATTILTRLAYPEESWEETGRRLGIGGPTCAVIHSRAIPKLRVFLFIHHLDLLGGLAAITEAYQKACVDVHNGLNATEAEVFKCVILDRQIGYRKAGWRLALRAACAKVIKWLALP